MAENVETTAATRRKVTPRRPQATYEEVSTWRPTLVNVGRMASAQGEATPVPTG